MTSGRVGSRHCWGVTIALAAVVMWGCSDSGKPTDSNGNGGNGGNGGPKTVQVQVLSQSFSPATARINVGDTVRWVLSGSDVHTTTSGTGSGDPNAGDLWDVVISPQAPSFTRVFESAGDFQYFCRPHEFLNMRGTVEVSAP